MEFVAIVVDNSASMQADDGGVTRFVAHDHHALACRARVRHQQIGRAHV
jgi:hypothetical protein